MFPMKLVISLLLTSFMILSCVDNSSDNLLKHYKEISTKNGVPFKELCQELDKESVDYACLLYTSPSPRDRG